MIENANLGPLKNQIDILIGEYNKEVDKQRLKPLWIEENDNKDDIYIGCFNISKMNEIMNALNSGQHLLYKHEQAINDYTVRMNPQKNRIVVETEDDFINEDKIFHHMMNGVAGNWYTIEETIEKLCLR